MNGTNKYWGWLGLLWQEKTFMSKRTNRIQMYFLFLIWSSNPTIIVFSFKDKFAYKSWGWLGLYWQEKRLVKTDLPDSNLFPKSSNPAKSSTLLTSIEDGWGCVDKKHSCQSWPTGIKCLSNKLCPSVQLCLNNHYHPYWVLRKKSSIY